MKKLLISVCLATAALLLFPAYAQQTRQFTADKHNEYGLVYNLPLTTIDIEVVATHTVRKAGPYMLYAKKYIGNADPVMEDSEEWQIKEVRLTPRGIADSEEQYLMQLKPGATTYIQVAEDGMLLAVNTEVQPAVQQAPLQGSELTSSSLDGDLYLQYVGEEFLSAQSRPKRARLLWDALMEARNARLDLSKGTAETMPQDGRQLELMLGSLQQQEQALTDAFNGTVQTQTVVRKFNFTPDMENVDRRNVVCRFSRQEGFSDKGDPIYLSVKLIDEPELPKDDKGEEKKIPKDAVMYCLPGTARITLRCGDSELCSQDMQIAQYGTVFGLNPSIFTDKKEPSFATFNPITGALESIGEKK